MTAPVVLRCTDARYRHACAELPRRLAEAEESRGAVVVVPGAGDWVSAAAREIEAGATALVVADPDPSVDLDSLERIARRVPIVLDRPWFRADLCAELGAAAPEELPLALTAECIVPAGESAHVVADALGWLRVLGRGGCEVVASRRSGRAALAQLLAGGGMPASLLVTELASGLGGPSIRVLALGGERVEVVTDAAANLMRVRVEDSTGSRTLPRRFESRERLSLRRALAAVGGGEALHDAEGFARDIHALRSISGTL
ncbi:hypothetical protein OH146_09010 [Salinibacterium sp. SYSU T00001]|uniref:hypothetical protein n=1 Tax=Homoserinimonas sedimenticola TaxID=2986805 RepID=UPI0022365C5A|nr:hypothetical protein [Salinibacterium sedimenticola]MCW4385911.1 hypothetical protein [Salinibacterium sedimenticola]